MASIDLTPEMADALRVRLSREYADVCTTNFALDLIVEALQSEVTRLSEYNTALLQRIAKQDLVIHEQSLALGSKAAQMKEKRNAAKNVVIQDDPGE